MPLALDFHGFKYDAQEAPSYIEINDKFYWHRPPGKMLDKPALDALMTAKSYTPKGGEIGTADAWLAEHLGMGHGVHGGGGGRPVTPPTVNLAPANFDVTAVAADGDATPPGNVGSIHVGYGAGSPTVAADATVTFTVTTTGTGAGQHAVDVLLTAGMTAQQSEAAIVTEMNALNNNAGIPGVTAKNGQGTNVDLECAAGTQITGVTVAVT